MQFEGRVKEVMPVQSGISKRTGEPWRSQQFVFGFYETSDSIYEKDVILTVRNDKIDQYKLQVGDKIKAKFSLGIRLYEGKKYNEIYTGDIEILSRTQQPQAPAATTTQPAATAPTPAAQELPAADGEDDLPF